MNIFVFFAVLFAGIAIFVLGSVTTFERRRRAGVETLELTAGQPDRDDAVVMRPTAGLRFLFLGIGAFAMWFTWGPLVRSEAYSFALAMTITVCVFYIVVFISNYEARYDSKGVTAPGWFFRDRHYEWAHLINTGEQGNLLYKIKFMDHGTLHLQKYLVGMPAFLTFLSDVEAMNRET